MAGEIRFEMACGSDTGRVRARNEDQVRILPRLGLAVLSDGMGGHKAGDVASRIAVEAIGDYWERLHPDGNAPIEGEERVNDLLKAVSHANERIYSLSQREQEFQGMGGTVIAAHFNRAGMCAIHLGDSRLYRHRFGQLLQITSDHTHAQKSVRMDLASTEETREGYGWNLLLKALGVDPVIEPDIIEAPVEAGDVYLIGSDGLTNMVGDADLGRCLARNGELTDAVEELIDLANRNGGLDNVSVVLVRILFLD